MDNHPSQQSQNAYRRKPSYNRLAMIGFAIGAGLEAMLPDPTNPDPELDDVYLGTGLGAFVGFLGLRRSIGKIDYSTIAKESSLYAFAFTAGKVFVKLARPYIQ